MHIIVSVFEATAVKAQLLWRSRVLLRYKMKRPAARQLVASNKTKRPASRQPSARDLAVLQGDALLGQAKKSYGFRLGMTTNIGKRMQEAASACSDADLTEFYKDAPMLKLNSYVAAKRFLEAVDAGEDLDGPTLKWCSQFKWRHVELLRFSDLSRAVSNALAFTRCSGHIRLDKGESAPLGAYKDDGAVARIMHTLGDTEMQYAPQTVVNWIYQAIVDVMARIHSCFPPGGRFSASGEYFDKNGARTEGGEVVLFWGSELGSRREQSLIAWDYDADLAVFVTPGVDFKQLWCSHVSPMLLHLGLRLVEHDPGFKFRVTPDEPLAWAAWKELYQETREQNPGLSRGRLMSKTKKQRQRGAEAVHPHGANCIDVEVYTVRPGKQLVVRGTNKFKVSNEDVFPVVEGIFGPLRVPLPRTPKILDNEYGSQWRTARKPKVIRKGGRAVYHDHGLPDSYLRSVWPNVTLRRCGQFLGGFQGASLEPSKDDVPWRTMEKDPETSDWRTISRSSD